MDVHLSSQVRWHGTGCRAPFATLHPWTVSRRRWRRFSSLLTFNSPFLILMLLHALYERLCMAPLNRLPCYGALEVIVTLLLLLLTQPFCWLMDEELVSNFSSVKIYSAVVWDCSVGWPLHPVLSTPVCSFQFASIGLKTSAQFSSRF